MYCLATEILGTLSKHVYLQCRALANSLKCQHTNEHYVFKCETIKVQPVTRGNTQCGECGNLSINILNKQFNNLKGDYSKIRTTHTAAVMQHYKKTQPINKIKKRKWKNGIF